MKAILVAVAVFGIGAYSALAVHNYRATHVHPKTATVTPQSWCRSLKLGELDPGYAPAGAVIGKPYTVDGRNVVDWVWSGAGVTVSWSNLKIVYKNCG